MISVIAKLPIKEGKVEEAITAVKELMVQVAREEGTLMYTLNRDQSNPNTLVIMERYKDKAAFDVHASTPHFKAFFAKSKAFLGGRPEVTLMEEIHSIR
jgi:quinol monooxygenase YgiN